MPARPGWCSPPSEPSRAPPTPRGLAALRTFQIPCEAGDPSDVGGLFFQAQEDGSELPDTFSTTQGLWGPG